MIDVKNALKYFEGKSLFEAWNQYSTEQQASAIEQAKRDLSRALGRPMREDEPPYEYGDKRRDEFAVYEQAIYTLIREAHPCGNSGNLTPALPVPTTDTVPVDMSNLVSGYDVWSKNALQWLADKVMVELIV